MWVCELQNGRRDRRHFIPWSVKMETLLEEKEVWAIGIMFADFVMTLVMEWLWLSVVEVIVEEGIQTLYRTVRKIQYATVLIAA